MLKPAAPPEFPIPLWVAGAPRPSHKERRGDPGALDRHAQEQSGALPARQLIRRKTGAQPPATERVTCLWS